MRDKDGNVTKVYLGKDYQPLSETKKKKQIRLLLGLTILLLLGLTFFFFHGSLQSPLLTGAVVVDVYQTVSTEARMEVDGVEQAIPVQTGGGSASHNTTLDITTLSLDLKNGNHTIKIFDKGKVVFEKTLIVNETQQEKNNESGNVTQIKKISAAKENETQQEKNNESGNVTQIKKISAINELTNETQQTNRTIQKTEQTTLNTTQFNATLGQNQSELRNQTILPALNASANETELSSNQTKEDYDILEEKPVGEVRPNKEVQWVRKVRVKNEQKEIIMKIPKGAKIRQTGAQDNDTFNITEGRIKIKKGKKKDLLIEYNTSGPAIELMNISKHQKRIMISANLPFVNVTAEAELPSPTKKENIKLFWIVNGTKTQHPINLFTDRNNDSLIDAIEWTVPHLSNQTFEISITVLNVYTYLRDNENWTVFFNTTGQADLIITPQKSTFTEFLHDNPLTFNELEFLSFTCDETDLKPGLFVNTTQGNLIPYRSLQQTDTIAVQSLVYPQYTCDKTGAIKNNVKKAGYAVLEFNFGGQLAYAIDPAPSITSVILNSTNMGTNDTSANLTVWPRGASADTNSYIYNWLVNGTSTSILYVPMTDNASSSGGQTVFDFSGYNNYGILGSPTQGDSNEPAFQTTATNACPGPDAGCYSFDGGKNNQYINFSQRATMNITRDLTIEAWVNVSSFCGVIVSRDRNGGEGSFYLGTAASGTTISACGPTQTVGTGRFGAYLVNTTGNSVEVDSLNNIFTFGVYHVVTRYNGSAIALYVNGTETTSSPFFGNLQQNNSNELYIGAATPIPLTLYFNGTIGSVIIYNRSLSSEQIASHYRSGLGEYNVTVAQETFRAENWSVIITPLNATGWNGSALISNGLTILNSPPSLSRSSILNTTNILTNNTATNLTVYADATDGDNDRINFIYNWLVNGTSITVLNVPMTDNASTNGGQTVFDFSGYNNYGILGSDTRGDSAEPVVQTRNCPGPDNVCYAFNGSQYINFSARPQFNITQRLTIEAWVNTSTSCSAIAGRLKSSTQGSYALGIAGSQQFGTCTQSATTGRISLTIINASGYSFEADGPTNIFMNKIYHLTATYNTTQISLYVNGSLVSTNTSIVGNIGINNSIENGIGNGEAGITAGSGSSNFNGTIGDVRIYNLTLTPQQVWENYLNGAGGYNQTVQEQTFRDESWKVTVTPIDSFGWNGTTNTSNTVTIPDAPPSITSAVLNTTDISTNNTNQNLTAAPLGGSDPDQDAINYVYNWYVNGTSITVLNVPMTNNITSRDGQTTFDFSGYNNYGILGNPALGDPSEPVFENKLCPGPREACYKFNGKNQYINFSARPQFNITRELTLEAWINASSFCNTIISRNFGRVQGSYILGTANTTSTIPQCAGQTALSGRAAVTIINNSGYPYDLYSNVNLSQYQVYHLVATVNTTTIALYVNGTFVGSNVSFFGSIQTNNSNELLIGSLNGTVQNMEFNGTIGDVKIYNRSLSAEQIRANYYNGLQRYNLTVNQEFRKNENWSVAVTPLDILSLNGSTVFSNNLTIANSPPHNVTLTTPENNSFWNMNRTFLNWTTSVDNDSDPLTYFLFLNGVNRNATTMLNVTQVLADGRYDWTILVGDGQANSSFAFNRTFTVDTINPTSAFLAPTEANNTFRNSFDWIFVNVSLFDLNLANITFGIRNSTSTNTTVVYLLAGNANTTTNVTFNFTRFSSNSQYLYNVTVYDQAGNVNVSETSVITLDNTNPQTAYDATMGVNNTFRTSSFFIVNATVFDANLANITFQFVNSSGYRNGSFQYLLSTNANTTTNVTLNISFLSSNSQYLYNVTVYDQAGNVNTSETRVITLDTTNPQITYVNNTELNNTFFNRDFIFMNISLFEANPANSTFMLFNTTGLVNQTTYALSIGLNTTNMSINFTGLDTNMQYTYNVTVIDFAGNSNTTVLETITLDNTNPVLTITSSAGTSYTVNKATTLTCTVTETNPSTLSMTLTSDNSESLSCTGTTTCDISYTATLTGTKTITCTAEDKAGNTKKKTITLTVNAQGGAENTPASVTTPPPAAVSVPPAIIPLSIGGGRAVAKVDDKTSLSIGFEEDKGGVKKPRIDVNFKVEGTTKDFRDIGALFIPSWIYALALMSVGVVITGASMHREISEITYKGMQTVQERFSVRQKELEPLRTVQPFLMRPKIEQLYGEPKVEGIAAIPELKELRAMEEEFAAVRAKLRKQKIVLPEWKKLELNQRVIQPEGAEIPEATFYAYELLNELEALELLVEEKELKTAAAVLGSAEQLFDRYQHYIDPQYVQEIQERLEKLRKMIVLKKRI